MALEVLTRLRLPIAPVAPTDVARKMDIIAGSEVDYAVTPIDTGTKWVEGSPVWRVVFVSQNGPTINTNNSVGHTAEFVALVRLTGYCIAPDGNRYPVGYSDGSTFYYSVRIHENGYIEERHGHASLNGVRMFLILDYVPEAPHLTIWDAGTTVWDAGATLWD